jgi:phosphoribosylglycinamide formyltransferase-1
MSAQAKLQLAVLLSGRGSNMLAIARSCREGLIAAQLAAVISDRACAPGIAAARELGLRTSVIDAQCYPGGAAFEDALEAALRHCGAELIVLAGFMRILSPDFVRRHSGRLLNIHPSLLPRYPGLHTHRRVLEAAEREHGASVHFVSEVLDGGPVICQARVPVRALDSELSLAARVQRQEHRIYPLVIGLIASGRLRLQGATILLDGQVLASPIAAHAERELAARGEPPDDAAGAAAHV